MLTLLHSEWPKLHRVLAILSAVGLTYHMQGPQYIANRKAVTGPCLSTHIT